MFVFVNKRIIKFVVSASLFYTIRMGQKL